MEFNEGKTSRSHVINKIKRISVSIDRSEYRNYLLLVGLLCVLSGALLYYFLL